MQRFIDMYEFEPPLQEAEGRFRGVGGKVSVAGRRTIPLNMKTLDGEHGRQFH